MYCKNCGAELNEKAGMCKNCGWEPMMEETDLMKSFNPTEDIEQTKEFNQMENSESTEENIQIENEVNPGDSLYTYNRNSFKKHINQLNLSRLITGKGKWIIVAVIIITLITAISITSSDSYKIDKAADSNPVEELPDCSGR